MKIATYLLLGFIAGCEVGVSDHSPSEAERQTPSAQIGELDASSDQRGKSTLDLSSIQDEVELRCLRLIHDCSTPGGCQNPIPNIRAVNALIPLGTDRALKLLRKYVDLPKTHAGPLDDFPSRVFTPARIAFVARDKNKFLRPSAIGSFEFMIREDSAHWPLYPFVLQDGIPFDLSQGAHPVWDSRISFGLFGLSATRRGSSCRAARRGSSCRAARPRRSSA